MSYIQTILLLACITLISVMGVYLLTGLLRLFSFGQASFMALGAYAAGLAVKKLHYSFPVAMLAAIVVAGLAALIIGAITLRLRKDFFSLVTLAFGEAIAALLNYFVKITGGATGMTGIPKRTTPVLIIISAIIVVFMMYNVKKSRFGRICIAIKNDELTAKSFSINTYAMKLMVFVVSAMVIAYAGVLYAFFIQYVEPTMFSWNQSAEWVIFLFFGGSNSVTGAVVSTLLLTALPEILRFASQYKVILYCVLVLLTINFRPKGLFGDHELNIGGIVRYVRGKMHKNDVLRNGREGGGA